MKVIGAALITLLLAAGANLLIDPMGIFFTARIPGLNVYKPEVLNYWHINLPLRARMLRPEAAVLGSSRVLAGIDTRHAFFSGKITANLGLPGATFCDVADALDVAAAGGRLKTVLIGLDFFAANSARIGANCGLGESATQPWLLAAKTLLSSDTLNASLKTATKQHRVDPAIWQPTAHGTAALHPDYVSKRGGVHAMFAEIERVYAGDYYLRPPACEFPLTAADGGAMAHFRRALRSAHARGLEVRMFVSPEHARLAGLVQVAGLASRYREWLDQLQAINREEAARAGKPAFVIRFPFDPAWVTESVPAASDTATQPAYFLDGSHYTVAVGNAILASFASGPGVTGETGPYFDAVTSAAKAYLAARPGERAELEGAVRRVRQECRSAARP